MDETPNLGLPYIMAAQSQKHVTHNEAIRALDAIVQLSVLDRDLTAPPGSPANGARYIVAASPTGAWSGHAGDIAAYQDGAWALYDAVEGFIAWVADEDAAVVWNGSAWTALTTGSGGAGSFTTVGINATADATNRLAVAAAATLLNHAGAGHQLKINKAAAADTVSLLYQDGFSGRAELGLTGDDDFHFKVSADGSTWKEAIVIDRSTAAVTFPFTALSGGRQLLTANRTYYVRTDGSDSNTGLTNSSGGAFLTIAKFWDVVCDTLDVGGKTVTCQIADGTYTAGLVTTKAWVGGGSVVIQGNSGTPANVLLNCTTHCFSIGAPLPGIVTIKDMKLTNNSGTGIRLYQPGRIEFSNINFGAIAGSQVTAQAAGAVVAAVGNYTISGGASYHFLASDGGTIATFGQTVTLTGTPAFSLAFGAALRLGLANVNSTTWSGSATGTRFDVENNGVINTGGGGANYLPGNAAGTGTNSGTSPYGLYV